MHHPGAEMAFFDLDETITDRDTDMLWALWRVRHDPLMGAVETARLILLNRAYHRGTLTGERYLRYQKFRLRGLAVGDFEKLAARFFEECG
jgi:hypothetical protein